MSVSTKRRRTKRSYQIELGLGAAMWVLNLYEMVTRFHTMSFPMAASAVMLFLLVPLGMWQAAGGLREAS